jgi:Domain of unknown function (DUF4214)
MALSSQQNELIKLYVAGFLRAPEKGGFEYWSSQLNTGTGIGALPDVIFSLPVVKAVYPDNLSNAAFVTSIYNNVFNKLPDSDGRNYWQGKLDGGLHRGQLVLEMINAGLNVPDGTPGKAYIVNRVAVAAFAIDAQVTQQKEIATDTLKGLLAQVTESTASVTQVKAGVNNALASISSGVGRAFANEFIAAAIHWQIDHNHYSFDDLASFEPQPGSTHAQVFDLLTIDVHPNVATTTPGFVTISLYHEHNWKLTAQDMNDFYTALAKNTYVSHVVAYQQAQDINSYIQETQASTAMYDQLVAQAPNYSALWY